MVTKTGGARDPHTNYKTSKYCVAYLDVLGGKDIIRNDNNNEHLNTLNMIFRDAISDVENTNLFSNDKFFVKIFSDNIILAVKIDEEDKIENKIEKIGDLVVLINNIVEEILNYGYLIRGAIVEGDFFCDNIFVYGKALIDVVELEEKYAIYPRIIAQESIQQLLPHCFYKDIDGWNVLNTLLINDHGFLMSSFKESLKNLLKKNKDNKKALQKIMWAINYFNDYNSWKKLNKMSDYCFISNEEISDALK